MQSLKNVRPQLRKIINVKKLIFISGLVIVFVACGSNEQKTEEPTVVSADTAKTDHAVTATPEVKRSFEHYYGKLPCTDCEGISTEITLKSDSTYMIHSLYMGRKSKGPGSNEKSEEGRWMMHGRDTVHMMGRDKAPSMFIKTDSSLIQLDMKGKMIEGKLKDRYVLKKS